MNKKLLGAALIAGLGLAHAASAQEFDDRWYITGAVGYNFQDGDRRTEDTPFGSIGLGKFISPNWSVDGELNYQNPGFDSGVAGANPDLNWSRTASRWTCVATSSPKAAPGTPTCCSAWATSVRKRNTRSPA